MGTFKMSTDAKGSRLVENNNRRRRVTEAKERMLCHDVESQVAVGKHFGQELSRPIAIGQGHGPSILRSRYPTRVMCSHPVNPRPDGPGQASRPHTTP